MAWLRLYDDILDDPKIQLLSDRDFRMLINLWCVTKRHDGIIPENMKILTFTLRLTEAKICEGIQTLVEAGLIERTRPGWEPHNWKKRQFETDVSTTRVKRFRERHKKQDETVSETAQETAPEDREQNTESPPIPPPKGGDLSPPRNETFQKPLVLNKPGPDFGDWWDAYPVKKCKDAAEKAWLKAVGRVSPAVLLAAAKHYAAELKKPGAAYPVYPQNWLSEGRWTDATGPPNGAEKLAPEHAAALRDKADKLLKRGKYAEH